MKSVVLLLSFLLNVYFGLYVAKNGLKNRTHRYFVHFVCSVSVWSLSQLFLVNLNSLEHANWIGRIAFLAVSFIPCSFFSFALVFPRDNQMPYIRRLACTSYILGFAFGLLFLFSDMFTKGAYVSEWGIRPVYGPGFKYFSIYAIILMGISLFFILRNYVTSNDTVETVQLKLILYAVSLFTILGVLCSLILPLFGFRQFSNVSSSFSIVIIGGISYAIMRYRFIDLRVAIKKGFVNSILSGILVSFLLIIYALMQDVLYFKDSIPQIVTITLLAVLIAFGFNRLARFITYLVDYLIFKGKYDYPRIASNFSRSISNILEIEELKNVVNNTLTNVFEANKCVIFINSGSEPLDVSLVSQNYKHTLHISDVARIINSTIKSGHNDDIIVKSELEIAFSEKNARELKAIFNLLDCEVISVLQSENAIIGIITLGEKTHHTVYTNDELNLLRSLSSQAAIVFTRAIHYQKNIDLKVQYENILRQMSNGVIVTDQANDLVYINSKAIEMLVIKNIDVEKIALDHLPNEIKTLLPKAHFQDIEPGNRELKIKLDGGRILPVNCSVATLCGKDGEILGLITVLTDLTEIKKWEEKARQADKLASLGTLAAGMAHEIKNPLSFIKSFTQMVPENLHDPQFFLSNASIAEKQVNSINFIVEQLLHYAMPSPPCFQELVAQDVIGESLVFLRKEFQSKNIEIKENYPDQPIKFSADSKQIKQILLNLLLNAIHAMAESREGQIGISLTEGQITEGSFKLNTRRYFRDAVIIKISDSGKGIPAQFVPQVFDPFFTTKDKGSGLGLAVVYSIIKEHGGYIDLETDPAKGTTFILTFPKKQEPPVSALNAGVNYEVFDKSQLDQEHVKNGSYSFS